MVTFKVIVVGDCNVGKTSLITRLTKNHFSYERVPTNKTDEVILHPMSVKNHRALNYKATMMVGLELWDTLG
jgi:GTPase SAR1 family protein